MSSGKALNVNTNGAASGGSFNLTNNSSLIGFKGTEDLGNGLKGLFQFESNINVTANTASTNNGATYSNTSNSFSSLRDTYVGASSKYGTVLGGYLSTPYRSALNSFDVMPGATGVGRIENLMGNVRLNNQNFANAGTVGTGGLQASASIRTTAIAYALPTLYGFSGVVAYTGNSNGANSTGHNQGTLTSSSSSVVQAAAQQAVSVNLGWEGYGIGIKGAYQQAKVNYNNVATSSTSNVASNLQGYTSYLVGAQYTGVPGLKLAAVYGRNTLGLNSTSATSGAAKGSNNQFYLGASYRFGNNEPRLSWATTSNMNGDTGFSQDGGRQITANWGYYLSKRTQVYGLVSAINNNANGIWNMAGSGSAIAPTGGQNILTYGAGMRTNF